MGVSFRFKIGLFVPYVVELTYIKKTIPSRRYNFNYRHPSVLDTNSGPLSVKSMEYLSSVNKLYNVIQ